MEGGGSEGEWKVEDEREIGWTGRHSYHLTEAKDRKWGGGGRGTHTRRGKEDAIAALVKRDIQSWGFVRTLVR